MEELLSNSWVVSIISGIFVFLITNFFVMLKGKRESRKLIYDANYMVINHIRGYVVDNGLPSQKIIEAVKNAVAREYNVKYVDLLSTKELCEELIKDIIGNTYISNDNRKIYINMLEKYLEQNDNIEHPKDDYGNKKLDTKSIEYISTIISIIAGLFTMLGTGLFTTIINITDIVNEINIYNLIAAFGAIVGIAILLYFIDKRKK